MNTNRSNSDNTSNIDIWACHCRRPRARLLLLLFLPIFLFIITTAIITNLITSILLTITTATVATPIYSSTAIAGDQGHDGEAGLRGRRADPRQDGAQQSIIVISITITHIDFTSNCNIFIIITITLYCYILLLLFYYTCIDARQDGAQPSTLISYDMIYYNIL